MITKENILSKLRLKKTAFAELGVSDIGLFGSYAHNTQTHTSDIDLLIHFKPGKENFDNYMAAYDLFESLFNGTKIEIVTKNGLSPHNGPRILSDVVYV